MKLLLTFIAAVTWAQSSYAFEVISCQNKDVRWEQNSAVMNVSKRSFPVGSSWRTAIRTSFDLWNQNPSKFRFGVAMDDENVSRGNLQNEVWFTNDDDLMSGAPALASMVYDCIDWWIIGVKAHLVEVDVIFDNRVPWASSTSNKFGLTPYGGNKRPFINAALHELGHAVGLMHADDLYNVMGQESNHIHANGSVARAYVGEDSSHGVANLYGLNSSNVEDVSVTHWKYDGPDGEGYSLHERTAIYSLDDRIHANTPTNENEPRYFVKRGADVKVEMTYENNGKSRQRTLKVGFFISTNSLITTRDRRIGGAALDLGRNQPYTTRHKVSIPSDLQADRTYYLGVIVDETNEIEEIVERNNATYTIIKVLP